MRKASLRIRGQVVVLLGRDSVAKHRPVAGVADSGCPVNDRAYSYAGNAVESVTSLSIVCSKTSSTVAPTFDPSGSIIQTCWPCSKGPRAMTLSKMPSSVAGLSSTSSRLLRSFRNLRVTSGYHQYLAFA